jgi:hypothetical protein
MRFAQIVGIAGLWLVALGNTPGQASPRGFSPAAGLSAAAGGSLDSDLGEAGSLAHPIDYSSIRLIPGRSIEYRRRVALEMQLAAASHVHPDRATAITSRTAD